MRKLAQFASVLAAGALALGLSGCGSEKNSSEAKSDSGTVTIVTNGSWTLGKEALAKAKAATGQDIKLLNGEESGTLDSKLILRKDSPLGDMAVGLTANNIVKVAKAGVVAPNKVRVPASAEKYLVKQAEGALPLDRSDVCANYDIDYFKTHNLKVPQNYDDLLKPEYKGLTVVENPAKSDTGLGMLLATVQQKGADGFLQYWKNLVANGAKAVNTWDEAYNQEFTQGEGKGKYPIVMSYSSSPYWSVSEDGKSAPTANIEGTCYPAVEYGAVLKGAKNASGAEKVLTWLYSQEGQNAIMTENITYPIDEQVKLDPKLEKFAPRPHNEQQLDVLEVERNRAEWIRQVQAVLG
ncbi:MAG: thiamine ABC transporter substrate binding subunit [Varibaculum timonense]|uniref:thiamine ABC transporter substrate-binding protein n=1 Tax=uncultured Varibaculum sp. TaxID=413896 RepID=UPI002676D1CD|nr:thiamine ABC transporter substrate-binding protein [uncultured Varibaculum sp.]